MNTFNKVDAQGTFFYPPFVEFSVNVSNEPPVVSQISIHGSDRKGCFFKLSHNRNEADTSYSNEGLNSSR